MTLPRHRSRRSLPLHQRLQGWAVIAAFLWLSWLSADASAHAHVHTDADQVGHVCAVTDFVHSGADLVVPLVVAFPATWTISEHVISSGEEGHARIEHRLPWAIGPPNLV